MEGSWLAARITLVNNDLTITTSFASIYFIAIHRMRSGGKAAHFASFKGVLAAGHNTLVTGRRLLPVERR